MSNRLFRHSPSRFHDRNRPVFAVVGVLSLAAVMVPATVHAQATTATLGGTVTDQTGAVIPNASVSLKSTTSRDIRETKSDGKGVFSFAAIPSGNYTVDIAYPGFDTYEAAGIHLDPGDERSLRAIKLAVGARENVIVSDTTAQLDMDSGELSNTISASEIQHLPVEGRDVTELLKILPGMAINNGTNVENSSYDPSIVNFTGALGAYSGNGTAANATSLLTDGADITDPGSYGIAIQNVNYEQVAEVKVQTSSFTADTARGPIVINTITKSGGDHFHGALYTYARTYQLNSTDWLANNTGQAKPPDRVVYPGFTLGGPVLIPGTDFNHSRKLTFFVGAEEYAQRNIYAYNSASSATVSALVPTVGMRSGDFSQQQIEQYLGPFYQAPASPGAACNISIYNNLCNVPQTGPGGQALTNGNIGPYIDPEAKLLVNGWPIPNHTVTDTTQGNYNWITTNLVDNNLWQARGRVDYAISERNHFFADYSIESGQSYQPGNQYGPNFETTMGGLNSPGGGLVSPITSHVASFDFTSVLNPTLTNTFYAAGAYFSQVFKVRDEAPYLKTAAVQSSGNSYEGLFNNGSQALPSPGDFGTDGIPFETIFDPTFGGVYTKKQIRTAGDDVSKLFGKHTIKTGIYYQWSSNPQKFEQNTNGSFYMYYLPASWNDPVAGTLYNTDGNGYGGNYTSDFMEGHLSGYTQDNIPVAANIYFWNLSGYIQDHWVVSPQLSVDAGIRLEHETPWSDAHGIGIAVFDPSAYAKGTPSTSPGIEYHSIDSGIPMSGIQGKALWPEPRFGFAYNPIWSHNTVVRGGYGLYRQHDSFNDVDPAVSTAVGQRSYNSPSFTSLATVHGYQSDASSAVGFSPDQDVSALMVGDNKQPGVMTYNLAVDQQLGHRLVYEIAYAGNKSSDLLNYPQQNINALAAGALYKPQPDSRTDTAANAGYVYSLFTAPSGANNTSLQNIDQEHVDSFRRFPLYDQVNALQHTAYGNYNALQTAINLQGSHDRIGANYTWSKAMGTTSGNNPTVASDNYNPLNFSRTNIFNITYDANSGTLSHKRFFAAALNDWDISGYAGYQSGPDMPSVYGPNFSLGGTLTLPEGTVGQLPGQSVSTCSANPCNYGVGSQEIVGSPDIDLQPALFMSPQSTRKGQYANPNAFNLPTLGTNGTFHYPYFAAPAFFDTDLSVQKGLRITETSHMTLRLSAFNLLNRANVSFAGVDAQEYQLLFNETLNSTNLNNDLANARNQSVGFGTPTYKTGRRIVEMSLRYEF